MVNININEIIKKHRIPINEIDKMVDSLEISMSEAVDLWLSDKGIVINDEQEQLNKKANLSENKVIAKAREANPNKKRKVTKKIDDIKSQIINDIMELMKKYDENVTIIKADKIIEFNYNNEHYKIDLIKQRKK